MRRERGAGRRGPGRRGEGPGTRAAEAFCLQVLAGRSLAASPASDPHWSEALALLRAYRLLGLWVAERGRADGPDSHDPGAPLSDPLGAMVAFQGLRGSLTMEAAHRARAALRAGGFDVLLFKGAGLVEAGVYADPGARAMDDADLLIRGGEVEGAVALLVEAGFEPWVPWEPRRRTWLSAFTLTDAAAPAGIEVSVDLHWRIPYGSYRSGGAAGDEAVWAGADLERGLPSPEAHALLVAEHFVRHLRVVPHLVGIADLVRILPRVRDPRRLRELARERGALRPLQSLLWFLRAHLAVPLDGELAEVLEVPERMGILRARALAPARLLKVPRGRREKRLPGLLSQAALQGSPGDFVRELARVLHPPGEWLAQRAGPGSGGAVRRRLGYWGELVRWAVGRGVSPLSPNQEFERPAGRT